MAWTSGEIITANRLIDKNDRNAISSHITFSSSQLIESSAVHRLRTCAVGSFGQNFTLISGNIITTGGLVGQIDYDDVLVTQPTEGDPNGGNIELWTTGDAVEIKWPNILMNAGVYTVTIIFVKRPNGGIFELLHGSTRIGVMDGYTSTVVVNQLASFVYSPTTRNVDDLRLRCTSASYMTNRTVQFSRLEIMKTR